LRSSQGPIFRTFSTSHIMKTFIFRHVYQPPKTPEGQHQRPPTELQNLQKYEIIKNENDVAAPPIKVILLEDIEGIGIQFDVVEVNRRFARYYLLPFKKACHVSPFDLEYYARKKNGNEKRII